jgi:hypothetical protein
MQERKTPTSKRGGRGFSVAFSKSAQQISTPLLNGLGFGHPFFLVLPLIEWVDYRRRAEFIWPTACVWMTGGNETPLVE